MLILTIAVVPMAMSKFLKKVLTSLLEVATFKFPRLPFSSLRGLNMFYVGRTGTSSTAYLRVSSPSLERINAAGFNITSHEELLSNAETLVRFLNSKNSVSMCDT